MRRSEKRSKKWGRLNQLAPWVLPKQTYGLRVEGYSCPTGRRGGKLTELAVKLREAAGE